MLARYNICADIVNVSTYIGIYYLAMRRSLPYMRKLIFLKSPEMPRYEVSIDKPVYYPDEDTFLLIDSVFSKKLTFQPKICLEIGCGYGCVSAIVRQKYQCECLLSDINDYALECSKRTFELNNLKGYFIHSDLLADITVSADLIVFNPPYVPGTLKYQDLLDKALCGGSKGREVIERFLTELSNYWRDKEQCALFLVCIQANDVDFIFAQLNTIRFDRISIIAEKQLPTEKLYVFFAERGEEQVYIEE